MKRATNILEIPNSFRADPLTKEQLAEFYEDTIEVRTGKRGVSDIDSIYEACHEVREHNAHLLMGHWGCGKSTELNHLAKRLIDEGFPVKTIYCKQELDIINIDFSDIMLLLAEKMLELAKEQQVSPSRKVLDTIRDYQSEIVREAKLDLAAELGVEAGVNVETPKFLQSLLNVYARLKSSVKYSETSSTTIRTKIVTRIGEWIAAINEISEQLTDAETGRQPIIIFEDLDKGETGRVFTGHGEILSSFSFPIIYTFPIARSYLPEFTEQEAFFQISRLPMIEVKRLDGTPNTDGYSVIRAIVERRAVLSLFAPLPDESNMDVLDLLIEKTGGSLRNLFSAINDAATIARRRKEELVTEETAEIALERIKSSLSMRLEGPDYPFLAEIYLGKHRGIADQKHLQRMMQAGAVLEYNGKRWHDVHPLIVDFLKEIGELKVEKKP